MSVNPHHVRIRRPTGSLLARFGVVGALVAAGFLGIGGASAASSTLYVAQSGTNAGDCTSSASPCATITYALEQNDGIGSLTVEVSGTIHDAVDVSTLNNNLTISGADAPLDAPAVIDGSNEATVVRIEVGETAEIDHLSIEDGSVDGGIDNFGSLRVTDTTIADNASSQGSAAGGITNSNSLLLTDSTVANNTGPVAAGIYNDPAGTMTITDSTLTGNYPGTMDTIENLNTMVLVSDTIAGNPALGLSNLGSATVGATILADNSSGNCAGPTEQGPAFTSLGYNLTNDSPSGTVFCGFTQPTDIGSAEPDLGLLADNGGPTETMLPPASSPEVSVIPTGTQLGGVPVCPGTDQRGVARPQPATGAACTIGAVEIPPSGSGYYEVSADGGIFAFDAPFLGSMAGKPLNQPIVGMATTGGGYYEVASDGGIFNFGDAGFYGSMGGRHLNAPVVGMAATPDGHGYWLVASDGGIFNFGDAGFYGSMGGSHLNAPVVGMAATPDGHGYWLVASDGGIFNFGDAGFYGSMGGRHLNAPVVGMAATPDGHGYWLAASDGGIFNFGDAGFYGSTAGRSIGAPVVAITSYPGTGGYYEAGTDGSVYIFHTPFRGSMAGRPLSQPIDGMAVGVTS